MIFRTKNSTYELDAQGKRIRRLRGVAGPTDRQGLDGAWCPFSDISEVEVGRRVIIVWKCDGDIARSTMTTPVIETNLALN